MATQASAGVSISIPAINVNAPVVGIPLYQMDNGAVTWDTRRLNTRVGHFEGTAWFGQGGRIILGAHVEGQQRRANVFFRLNRLQTGDEIVIHAGDQEYRYQVTMQSVVAFDDLSILNPTAQEELVLMTCDSTSYSNGTYTRRIIIKAVRVN